MGQWSSSAQKSDDARLAHGKGDARLQLLAQPKVPNHIVQFYDDEHFLCDTVAHFLGAGLAAGETLFVVATPSHRTAFRTQLEANGFDVERICNSGQLSFIDAREALSQFMVGSTPAPDLFNALITRLLESSGRPGAPVRAYGEMVNLLCEDHNHHGALCLEELWNTFVDTHAVSLLCAYTMNAFPQESDRASFERICHAHRHTFPTESYGALEDEGGRLREIGILQQRARALESELLRRTKLEGELRQALREREVAQAEQRQSQENLQDFFENALEGLHWVAADGTIIWANQAECSLLGYTLDEYVGHHIAEFHADRSIIDDILARLSAGEALRDYEARLRCKDGSIKHVLIHSNVLWQNGKFVHTRCFTRDITARRLADEHLQEVEAERGRLLEEARAMNRLKDEFLATVSHELRTPLNAILGWSTMLRERPGIDAKKAISAIERNARAQARLIEDILDVSRIITGKLAIEPTHIDLAGVLRSSLDAVAPTAIDKGVTLQSTIEMDRCPFYGDPDRLQQVFGNLLSNAVKFTAKNEQVYVHLATSGSDIVLTVRDTGRGIRGEFLPLVFERFRQADSSTTRSERGLGLGLAIVRSLTELHGGHVRAESAGEGQGAAFTVTLPAQMPGRSAPESGPSSGSASPADFSPVQPRTRLLDGVRVVVCDDDADGRELVTFVLVTEGATVRATTCAREAIDEVREFRPDVLVSDIGLPVVDGYELIAQVRSLSEGAASCTPAIALTAFTRNEDAKKALQAGYQMHMSKPLDTKGLVTMVGRLLGRSPTGTGKAR